MSKISVILCTHNREKFLNEALASVKKQSFSDYELILVNDGSTDNTKDICEQYCANDNRAKVINLTNNRGLSYARNIGVKEATSKYIMFIDDDDYCCSNMFEHLYGLITEHEADIAITGCKDKYDDHIEDKYVYEEKYVLNKVQGLDELLKRKIYHTAPPTKLFKKVLFDGIEFIPGKKIDDIHIIYKIFAEANKVVAQGVPTYYFTKHSSNITSFITTNQLKPEILDEYIQMQDERVAYLTNKVPEIKERVRYERYSYMISMISKIKGNSCIDCERQFKKMVNILKENIDEIMNIKWLTKIEKDCLEKYVLID